MVRAIVLLFTPLMTLFLFLSTFFNAKDKVKVCLATGITLGAVVLTALVIAVFNPSLW